MKKLIWILSCLFSVYGYGLPIQQHSIPPKAFLELFNKLGIDENLDVIEQTQKNWVRPKNKERWQIDELPLETKEFVLNWAKHQKLFERWSAARNYYEKALILGATTGSMQARLNSLIDEWLKGVRFNEIIWLVGERPLDSSVDSLLDYCTTETEAANYIWFHTTLPIEMQKLPVCFISVAMIKTEDGVRRPNTIDTIKAWLKVTPKPTTCLFVSDLQSCWYQFTAIEAFLPCTYDFDMIGYGKDMSCSPVGAALVLNTLAWWIYNNFNSAKFQNKTP